MRTSQSHKADKEPFNALTLTKENTPFHSTHSSAHKRQNRGDT
jgi:hypothetical protein